jgi:hypothetical protein
MCIRVITSSESQNVFAHAAKCTCPCWILTLSEYWQTTGWPDWNAVLYNWMFSNKAPDVPTAPRDAARDMSCVLERSVTFNVCRSHHASIGCRST